MLGSLKRSISRTYSGNGSRGPRTLRQGMTGLDVARCQNLLNASMVQSQTPLWVDGIFGPKTTQRVREFQTRHRLLVDGIVGPQTRAELEKRKP